VVNYLKNINLPYINEMGIGQPLLFKNKRLDLTFTTTPQFQSLVKYRRATIIQLRVEEQYENTQLINLRNVIDRILELTKRKQRV